MRLGDAWIMIESAREGSASPALVGRLPQYVTVFVDDADAHISRTRAARATFVEDLNETVYDDVSTVSGTSSGTGGSSRSTCGTRIPRMGATVAAGAGSPPGGLQ